MIPALREAASDPSLTELDLRILIRLSEELDPAEFREVKQAWVAEIMQCSKRNVKRSLKRLVDSGYFERGDEPPWTISTYRIVYSKGTGLPPQAA